MTGVMCLSGCGNSGKSADGTEYKTKDVVTIPMSSVTTLNPVVSTDEDTYFISKLIYQGLFKFDENMTPQPSLAKSYEFSKANRRITIKLNRVKWSDGRDLTASDVVFSVNAYEMAGQSSEYADVMDKISYAKRVNRYEVKIYFDESTDMSLDMLTFPILPKHKYDSIYDLQEKKENFKPVGSGQYKVKKYDSSTKLILVPNDEYSGDDKGSSSLIFAVTPNKNTAYQLLESSNLSVMYSRKADRETNYTKSGIKTVNFPGNEVEFMGFNFDKEKMKDENLRKAIAYGIDTKAIIEDCYMNSGMQNDNLYYPDYLDTASGKDAYKYNEDKCAARLKKAGYKDRDDDGLLEDKNGSELTLKILVNADNTDRCDAADMIKSSMENQGISVDVYKYSGDSYTSALKNGNFDVYIGGLEYDDTMDMRILFGDEKTNYISYTNEELETLLDDLKSGETETEMKDTYLKIKSIMNKELPYYCLLYKTYGAVKAPTLQGTPKPMFNDFYRGIGSCSSRYASGSSDSSSDSSNN